MKYSLKSFYTKTRLSQSLLSGMEQLKIMFCRVSGTLSEHWKSAIKRVVFSKEFWQNNKIMFSTAPYILKKRLKRSKFTRALLPAAHISQNIKKEYLIFHILQNLANFAKKLKMLPSYRGYTEDSNFQGKVHFKVA